MGCISVSVVELVGGGFAANEALFSFPNAHS